MLRPAGPAAWGIPGSYRDALERRRSVPIRSQRAVMAAMGLERDAADRGAWLPEYFSGKHAR